MPHLWSGRFDEEPDASVFSYGVSLPFDRQLFEEDVAGSLAWAEALARAGILGETDAAAIASGLTEILDGGPARPVVRRTGQTRTFTRSSSGNSSSGSAKPASASTQAARATSRCPSIFASTSSAASPP